MKRLYNKTSFSLKGWEREEHFHFFGSFTHPCFTVHTEIDITQLYHYTKWEGLSLFLSYLHAATIAACCTENFLLRMEEDQVVKYAAVDISTTVLKDNKTIAFVHLPHHPNLHTFCLRASQIIEEAKKSKGLFYGYNGPDLIHATTLPWFKFNGMEHAHTDQSNNAIPKLAFGRLEWKEKQVKLPISVRVHHGLADGYHIHLFLENMQANVNAVGKGGHTKSSHKSERIDHFKTKLQHLSKGLLGNPLQEH